MGGRARSGRHAAGDVTNGNIYGNAKRGTLVDVILHIRVPEATSQEGVSIRSPTSEHKREDVPEVQLA